MSEALFYIVNKMSSSLQSNTGVSQPPDELSVLNFLQLQILKNIEDKQSQHAWEDGHHLPSVSYFY